MHTLVCIKLLTIYTLALIGFDMYVEVCTVLFEALGCPDSACSPLLVVVKTLCWLALCLDVVSHCQWLIAER